MSLRKTDLVPTGHFGFNRRLLAASIGAAALAFALSANPLAGVQSPSQRTPFAAIRADLDAGRYVEAESAAQGLVSALGARDATSPEFAEARDLLVEALARNGKGTDPQVVALADEAVRSNEAKYGAIDVALAPSLCNLGDVRVQRGDYSVALAAYERASALRERSYGPDHPDVADVLDRLARVYTLTERYDDALKTVDRALEIKERALSDRDDIRIARSLEARAFSLQRKGNYSAARLAIDRAMAIRERRDANHPEMAGTLNILAEQLSLEGNAVQAREAGSRAVALASRTLRSDHPDIAAYLRTLAVPISALGDLNAARALRERALAIAEKAYGPDHPAVAVQLNDLANSSLLLGDYVTARTLYERSQGIYERRLGPAHSSVMTEVYNLALLNSTMGDYGEARRLYNRAITTWEQTLGPQHPIVARALTSLAEMLSEQGLHAQALPLYQRALAIRERTLGREHRDIVPTLAALASTLGKLGRVQTAEQFSTRALQIWKASDAPDTSAFADAFRVDATLQAQRGDYEGARASLERALAIKRRIYGTSHPDVAQLQASLAGILADLKESSEALNSALQAEDAGRAHLELLLRYLPERQALEYAAKRPKGLDVALSLLESDPSAVPLALDAVVRGRTLILDEMAARRRGAGDADRPDLLPLWTALASTRQRLANIVVRGPSDDRPQQYADLIEVARREREQAERALAERSASFRVELQRSDSGLLEVSRALPPGSAIVSFVRYDRTTFVQSTSGPKPLLVRSYVAFVTRADHVAPASVPLGRADAIETLIREWRQAIVPEAAAPGNALTAEQASRRVGVLLRLKIWDPLATHLQGLDRVFVVPDAALNLVAFAALPVGKSKYLVEEGPVIQYLSAERDLVSLGDAAATGRGLLALGGAAFQEQATLEPATSGAASITGSAAAFRGARSVCGNFQSMRFEALPGSRLEVEEIAGIWNDARASDEAPQILMGRDAGESAFKRWAPGRKILHLATHGFVLGSDCESRTASTRAVGGLTPAKRPASQPTFMENSLLLSGLALAGANRRGATQADQDDGILTAEEVAAMNLGGVEWAVLSACDTGLGALRTGEGTFGLRRAFQIAGVRTVIMSLWSVDDQATRAWMRTLYDARFAQRMTTTDAVRTASLDLLRSRRNKGQSTLPFYWAAFVAIGDWR